MFTYFKRKNKTRLFFEFFSVESCQLCARMSLSPIWDPGCHFMMSDVGIIADRLRLRWHSPVATPSPSPASALVGRPEAAPQPGPTSRPLEPGPGAPEAGSGGVRPEWGQSEANAHHHCRAIEIQAIGQHFSLKRPQWYLSLYTKWTNKYQYSDESSRSASLILLFWHG